MSYHGTHVVVIEIPEGSWVAWISRSSNLHSLFGWIIESGGYVYGNNNRLRTERTLSRNCPCSIGRKVDRTRTEWADWWWLFNRRGHTAWLSSRPGLFDIKAVQVSGTTHFLTM